MDIALYIHWPFCEKKCPYCDFNSHVRDGVEVERWKTAYFRELAYWANLLPPKRLSSIFFGGGTPSLMPPSLVGDVLAEANRLFPFTEDIEITLEANPNSSEAAKFKAFRDAGVNRLSIGIQSFDDDALRFLGRLHDGKQGLKAIDMAASTFGRFSFDLIYARPEHTEAAWQKELAFALSLGSSHLSLYQLTIEPGTSFFHAHKRGDLQEIDEEKAAALYQLTQQIMDEAGLPAYEISNHARVGEESRHNLTYWRYHDYIGIGPGAHGRVQMGNAKLATTTLRSPEKWLQAVEAKGHGLETTESLESAMQAQEAVLMGLRLKEGVSRKQLATLHPQPVLNEEAIARLAAQGFLLQDAQRLVVAPQHWLHLNHLIERVLL